MNFKKIKLLHNSTKYIIDLLQIYKINKLKSSKNNKSSFIH